MNIAEQITVLLHKHHQYYDTDFCLCVCVRVICLFLCRLIKLTLLQVMYLAWFSTGMHKCLLRPLSLFEMKMLLNVRLSCGIFLQFHNILYAMTTSFDTRQEFSFIELALFTTGYCHSHTGIWMLYYENFIPRFTHVPVIPCNIV